MAEKPDVLVVGAGPVGLTLASECLRHGASVRLVERNAARQGESRALAVWSSALEALGIMGIADEFYAHGLTLAAVAITAEGRPLARIDPRTGVDSPYPQPVLLPQTITEEILARHLHGLGGAIEFSTELLSFEETSGGVVSRVRGPEGETQIESRWLVACDGAYSTVRRGLNSNFQGFALPEIFVLCDAAIDPAPAEHEAIVDWSPAGAFAVFPVRKGVFRIVSSRRHSDPRTGKPTLEEMREHLEDHGRGDWQLYDPTWLASFRLSERMAKEFRKGRVLLAGDAAHIHSPAGGQGMNTGIQDGFNLGWKLGLLAAGRGEEEALLASYHAERAPVAEKVLREATLRTRVSVIENPVASSIRNLVVQGAAMTHAAHAMFARNLAGLDIAYDESPVLGRDRRWHGGGFGPGERIRDVQIGDISLYHAVVGGPHCLLVFSGDDVSAGDAVAMESTVEEVTRIAGNFVNVLRVWCGAIPPAIRGWLPDGQCAAHEAFGARGGAIYLIRPDAYVAARCRAGDPGPVLEVARLTLGVSG